MSAVFRLILLLCLICHASITWACTTQDCIEIDNWQFGIALGIGVKTNPLVDGDNIPLVILPDIAWYAEQAYFDNGELGYQWLNKKYYAMESFVQLDQESAFFSFFHPTNIFVPFESTSATSEIGPSDSDHLHPEDETHHYLDSRVSVNQISKRKWAVNAGLRAHYFMDNTVWEASWQHDISGVHQGQIIELAYSAWWAWQQTQLNIRIAAKWKSENLLDYYYGIGPKDTQEQQQWYSANSGIEPYISVNVQKPITTNWLWISSINYQKLSNSMKLSPLVDKSSVKQIFIGIAYRF